MPTDPPPTDPLPLAHALIAARSVSAEPNAPAADLCAGWLRDLGFTVERSVYRDPGGVAKTNLLARLGPDPGSAGADKPGFVWLGHTDVVPAAAWTAPGGPFAPAVENGRLYGRGACDMKGPVACALAAAARLVESGEPLSAPLWVALTADEEVGFEGAKALVAGSAAYRELRSADPPGVIGEPTSLISVHAHKGSHLLTATARGVAAHSGTAAGVNANRRLIPFLADLLPLVEATETDPDQLDPDFDPPGPSWNLTLPTPQPAMNVVPGEATVRVYARPTPRGDASRHLAAFRALAERHGLEWTADGHAAPFFTDPGGAFPRSVRALLGQAEIATVCYGTDGGVFADRGEGGGGLTNLLVLGPGSIEQAHTAAEFVELGQLARGCDLYEALFRRYCGG